MSNQDWLCMFCDHPRADHDLQDPFGEEEDVCDVEGCDCTHYLFGGSWEECKEYQKVFPEAD